MSETLPCKHVFYEAAVQSPEVDIALFRRMHKRAYGTVPYTMREDFCGTALLSQAWAAQSSKHSAVGIDLDGPTLEWAKEHRSHKRVTYLQEDVLTTRPKPVDFACALNFSYNIFKERETLKRYFQSVLRGLKSKGTFVIDIYGGPTAMNVTTDKRTIEAGEDVEGTPFPKFKYYWEQASFNFINNDTTCHISFKPKGGKKIKHAFTYEWRLWTLPELRDILFEAGFNEVEAYLEGWDDEADDTDGVFKVRDEYEDMEAWIAYLVATK